MIRLRKNVTLDFWRKLKQVECLRDSGARNPKTLSEFELGCDAFLLHYVLEGQGLSERGHPLGLWRRGLIEDPMAVLLKAKAKNAVAGMAVQEVESHRGKVRDLIGPEEPVILSHPHGWLFV